MQTHKKFCAKGGTIRFRFPSRQLAHREVGKGTIVGVRPCKRCGGWHTTKRR